MFDQPIVDRYTMPVIAIVEKKIEEPKPKEYTLEEKIKLNINNCNTDLQWIRADNAECLDKVSNQVKKAVTQAPRASKGYYYQCAGWVASKRYVPTGWGNATNWKASAQRAGWTISKTPVDGAIGWVPGHVVYAERVEGDRVLISEQNYDFKNSVRTIWVSATKYTWLY